MANIEIRGLYDSKTAFYLGEILNEKRDRSLVIVSDNRRASALASDLSFFVEKNIYTLKEEDESLYFYDAKNRETLNYNIDELCKINRDDNCIAIMPASMLRAYMMPYKNFKEAMISLKIGDNIKLSDISHSLLKSGYDRVKMVYGKGQFAIRGSILDIFSPTDENPVRIELFDTEIESIRSFNIDNQRSVKKLETADINPAQLLIYSDEDKRNFKEYLNANYKSMIQRRDELLCLMDNRESLNQLEYYVRVFSNICSNLMEYVQASSVFIEDLPNIREAISFKQREYKSNFLQLLKNEKVASSDFENLRNEEEIVRNLKNMDMTILSSGENGDCWNFEVDKVINYKFDNVADFVGSISAFSREVKKYANAGYESIEIVCQDEERKKRVEEHIEPLANMKILTKISVGTLSKGFGVPNMKKIFITDVEILGGFHKKKNIKQSKFKSTKPISAFTEIKRNDYVVHEDHGVGQYMGITQLEIDGIKKDLIHIKYAGNDALYVPVDQLDRVQKYIGSDSIAPKIYKLSGSDWKNTKSRTREAVLEMAKEIIQLSAIRKAENGFKFSDDTKWQEEFERSFPYDETEDQLRCISEIKADMERIEPMDRLLCGDVGYGKTEVAARAMFKCVMDSKQVAMLVPTTILADQHYKTLKERFKGFPVNIEMLSRFKTREEQRKIIEKIKNGTMDIVVGTHSLLSRHVTFKDLGLLVIDEEQRFGVSHKEKIKLLKENIDVLTLSATPIPRTLHMSLVGIRDMSLIEEPPHDRLPVQTFVVEEDERTIRQAINRELGRGGQVFIVYNKVKGINTIESKIKKLFPEVEVAVAHGQMGENYLEDTMLRFMKGDIKILITTTIIETGIDIPNANTQIVIDADKFGLSQLYQLRGRVGRSNKIAYAYLTYKKNKSLNHVAEKRLRAIKEFTEFGAGFKIAMRDLEIRGAGNILGAKQHGHIVSVGYELYTKMVAEAVAAIRGEIIHLNEDDVIMDLKIPAYIPNTYISNETLKFDIYRKVMEISSNIDYNLIKEELEDRFGNMPNEVINLLKVARIKYCSKLCGIKRIAQMDNIILIQFHQRGEAPIRLTKRHNALDDILDIVLMLGKKVEEQ